MGPRSTRSRSARDAVPPRSCRNGHGDACAVGGLAESELFAALCVMSQLSIRRQALAHDVGLLRSVVLGGTLADALTDRIRSFALPPAWLPAPQQNIGSNWV